MKGFIKSALRAVAPSILDPLLARRANAHQERVLARIGLPQLQRRVREHVGPRVTGGAFDGMYYIDAARGSAIIPKLVGSYEAELLPVWEGLALRPPDLIVDVGCAEGYYAVGLARLFGTQTRVLAYDVDPISRTLCSELACKNDVADRVTIRTECSHRELRSVLHPGTFVLCDCEGYEKELLDPGEVPELVNAEILVELHDAFIPGIKEAIIDRFSRTHRINLIESRERDPADYPVIAFLTPEEQGLALSEFRGGRQEWAHLVPIAQPGMDVSSRVPG